MPAAYGSTGAELVVGVGEAAGEPGAGVVAGAEGQRHRSCQRHVVPLPRGQRAGGNGRRLDQGAEPVVPHLPQREGLRRDWLPRRAHPPPVTVEIASARSDLEQDAGEERSGVGDGTGRPVGGREQPVGAGRRRGGGRRGESDDVRGEQPFALGRVVDEGEQVGIPGRGAERRLRQAGAELVSAAVGQRETHRRCPASPGRRSSGRPPGWPGSPGSGSRRWSPGNRCPAKRPWRSSPRRPSATTAGAIAPGSTVVDCSALPAARAGEAMTPVSTDPPAAPTAATPAARLKIFLRLSASPVSGACRLVEESRVHCCLPFLAEHAEGGVLDAVSESDAT